LLTCGRIGDLERPSAAAFRSPFADSEPSSADSDGNGDADPERTEPECPLSPFVKGELDGEIGERASGRESSCLTSTARVEGLVVLVEVVAVEPFLSFGATADVAELGEAAVLGVGNPSMCLFSRSGEPLF